MKKCKCDRSGACSNCWAQTEIVNVSMPKKFLVQVDELAKKQMRSRSEMVREMIRGYLEVK